MTRTDKGSVKKAAFTNARMSMTALSTVDMTTGTTTMAITLVNMMRALWRKML